MKTKYSAMITLCLAAGILLLCTAADMMTPDRGFSQTENRILAKRPDISVKALVKGGFTKAYETYVTDQFAGRDRWISIKTRTDIALGKKEAGGVYLANDGSLIEQHLPEEIKADAPAKKIALLTSLIRDYEERAGQIKVMLVPTADNVWTDKLPAFAPFYDQSEFMADVAAGVGDTHYIDTMAVMKAHAQEEIYYRTDHHWTTLGAYYGYQAWAESMNMTPVSYDDTSQKKVTEEFLGTLHSKINIPVSPDSIYAYEPKEPKSYKVYYDFSEDYTTSLYEEKHLATKNKYAYFLDDNHPFIRIETGVSNGKTLFIIKDSYANCFVPFAAGHYETVCIVDLRYYNMDIYKLIDTYMEEGKTDMLILYDVIHFLNDFMYYRFS